MTFKESYKIEIVVLYKDHLLCSILKLFGLSVDIQDYLFVSILLTSNMVEFSAINLCSLVKWVLFGSLGSKLHVNTSCILIGDL